MHPKCLYHDASAVRSYMISAQDASLPFGKAIRPSDVINRERHARHGSLMVIDEGWGPRRRVGNQVRCVQVASCLGERLYAYGCSHHIVHTETSGSGFVLFAASYMWSGGQGFRLV